MFFSYKLSPPFRQLKWMLPTKVLFGESHDGREVSLVGLLELFPNGSFHQNIDSVVYYIQ